jgi:orotate phosphoribosyltransferase
MNMLSSVAARRGHFRTESGYHTDLWMDLETLCRRPAAVQPLARALAHALRAHAINAVCGPLNEGAFIALLAAGELACDFTYAERFDSAQGRRHADGDDARLFPVRYALPAALRPIVGGRRIAIVNDVISAGSAVRGTWADLHAHGAQVVAIGCLLVLGDAIDAFAAERGMVVETLERSPYQLWVPADCPLCAARVPLETVT